MQTYFINNNLIRTSNQYLEKISIDREQFNITKKKVKKKYKIKKQIVKFKSIITKAEDRFFEELIDPETFKNSKVRYIKRIKVFENEILELKNFNPIFELQSRIEKIKKYDSVFTKGQFIHVLYENNKKYALYAIDKFFVEIEYDPKANKILAYIAFKLGHMLDKYAEAIEFNKE